LENLEVVQENKKKLLSCMYALQTRTKWESIGSKLVMPFIRLLNFSKV